MERRKKILAVVLIILAVALLVLGVYVAFFSQEAKKVPIVNPDDVNEVLPTTKEEALKEIIEIYGTSDSEFVIEDKLQDDCYIFKQKKKGTDVVIRTFRYQVKTKEIEVMNDLPQSSSAFAS